MKKIIDGIVDETKYGKDGSYKIMWILKEGNVSPEDIDKERNICEELLNDSHKSNALSIPTFRKMIYATYGILHPETEWFDVPFANDEAYEVIKKIANVNINKYPGGSISENDEIQNAYNENKVELLKQIKECNPEIIIFANTLQYFETEDLNSIGWNVSPEVKGYADETTYNTAYYITSPNKLCIHAYHPAYVKITDKIYWDEIKTAVQKWGDTRKIN